MKDYRELTWRFSSSSSGGQYLKSEMQTGRRKYYLKLSDFSYGSFRSHEAVLEVVVSRLGNILGLPVLEYTGENARILIDGKEHTTFVTRSLNYCKSGMTAMPIVTDYELNKLPDESPIDYCRRIGQNEYIDYIFIFDYLIMNTDRHGRNIELLYSGSDMQPAPIFDNGRCLTYECGNRLENILKWNYQESGMGNTFLGGIYLENNLNYVSKPYKLPRLDDAAYKRIFYGLSGILERKHIQLLREAIEYRYQVLMKKGVVL